MSLRVSSVCVTISRLCNSELRNIFPGAMEPYPTIGAQRVCVNFKLLDEMIYFQKIFYSLPCRGLISITVGCFGTDSETLERHPGGACRRAATRPRIHVWARHVSWLWWPRSFGSDTNSYKNSRQYLGGMPSVRVACNLMQRVHRTIS